MHSSFEDDLRGKLNARQKNGLLRRLTNASGNLVDFASNDYLGLAREQLLHEAIQAETRSFDNRNGSTGSRLLTGNSAYCESVEKYLATLFRGESALIFNSGYAANLSVLSTLPGKHDTIVYDELAHACIKDGARLSLAKRFSFRHNDMADLESKLKKSTGRIYIAVESVYSMDGDESPLNDVAMLARRYNAVVILDEAHSTGVAGKDGSGIACMYNLTEDITIRIYTFGKAIGVHGACVVGSRVLIDYLINFARPFIYTTALSPHSIASIRCAFGHIEQHPELQEMLHRNIARFIALTNGITNRTISNSAIQTLILPGNDRVRAAAAKLQGEGLDVRPILSPTVPAGSERLRICLHSYNTAGEIEKLANLLQIT